MTRARAQEIQHAPDPRLGERTDGRVSVESRYNALLAVPRIFIAPFRLALKVVEFPTHLLLSFEDRFQVAHAVYRFVTSLDGKRGLRPTLRYASRFQPQLGVTYYDKKLLGPGSSLAITFGAVLPAIVFADVKLRFRVRDPYNVALDASYLKRVDHVFAGVGLASYGGLRPNDSPRARYAQDGITTEVVGDIRLVPGLHLKVGGGWSFRKYGIGVRGHGRHERTIQDEYCVVTVESCQGSRVDPQRVPGFYEGANFFVTDAQLAYDTRLGTHDPLHLWYRLELGARYAQSPSRDGARWIDTKLAADLGFPLGGRTRMLAFRIALELLEPLGGSPVPFSELAQLGGPDSLRGTPTGRFRDFSSVLATAEYRWQLWMWMDAVVFTDFGGTFDKHFGGFRLDRLVPDVGVGVRLHTSNRFLMRLQAAYGIFQGLQFLFATSTPL